MSRFPVGVSKVAVTGWVKTADEQGFDAKENTHNVIFSTLDKLKDAVASTISCMDCAQ